MLYAFCGDTHGNLDLMFSQVAQWEERTKFSIAYLIQVGDFGIWPNSASVDKMTAKHASKDGLEEGGDFQAYLTGRKKAPRPVFFIRGNHESQGFLAAHEFIMKETYPEDYQCRMIQICPGFFYIPDGHVVTIGTQVFAGWGGNFSQKTWDEGIKYRSSQMVGRKANHMTKDVYERLAALKPGSVDVFLTHDAPVGSGVVGATTIKLPKDEMTGQGNTPTRSLIEILQPKYHFNGHWHQYRKNQFGATTSFVLDKLAPSNLDSHFMEVVEL